MADRNSQEHSEVDRFIMDRIDSVPHLEALLLLWSEPAQPSSANQLAKQLWVTPDVAGGILKDLAQDGLIAAGSKTGEYHYRADPEKDRLIGLLNETYSKQLIRISNMIHSKPSAAVRQFAKAFRLRKEE